MRLLLIIAALAIEAAGQQGWIVGESREGIDRLLSESVAKGKGRITLVLLNAGDPKRSADGEYVMGYGGQGHDDVSLPNPAFFQHLDWVIRKAQSKKVTVAILPADAGTSLKAVNSKEKFFEWGRYLGRRYMKAKGLIWLRQSGENTGPLDAIEAGIRQFDSIHPFETQ